MRLGSAIGVAVLAVVLQRASVGAHTAAAARRRLRPHLLVGVRDRAALADPVPDAAAKPSARRDTEARGRRPRGGVAAAPRERDGGRDLAMAAPAHPASGGDRDGPARRADAAPELTALGLAFRHLFRAVSRMRGRDTHLAGAELSHAQFELLIELDERGELLGRRARARRAPVARDRHPDARRASPSPATSSAPARTATGASCVARLTPLGQARDRGQARGLAERWERALADVSPREMRAATKVHAAARRRLRGGALRGAERAPREPRLTRRDAPKSPGATGRNGR